MKLFKRLFITLLALTAVGCAKVNTAEVTGVELNYTSYTLENNSSFQLEAYVKPDNARNKSVTWSVQGIGANYISVSDTGLVTAKKTGTARVLATTVEKKYTASCIVTVVAQIVPVTSVSLNSTVLSVKQGKTATLSASVYPNNATNKYVSWSSSNTNVATISSSGVINAVNQGSTTITVTTNDGHKTATCVVTVTEPTHVTSVSLDKTSLSLKVDKTSSLTANVLPSDAYDKSVSWSSSNTNVATVNDNGEITANTVGTTTITATTTDGGFTANCSVTVEEKGTADEWTVLIYMCGSTLETESANKYVEGMPYYKCGLATCDIREIIDVPNKPDDVNIVIETGGAQTWTTNANGKYSNGYSISNQYIQRHHVENGKIVLDEGQDKIKNEYMGKQSVLQSFLEYGFNNYPADKTALILWNHGGGMQGACFNDTASGYCVSDGLLGKEVVSAVSTAMSNCGLAGQKLEWIGYDACMMQIQDLAEQYSPYFKYMLGSQELESGTGWDYDTWLDDLYAGKDTETVLKAAVDGFIKDNGGVNDYNNDQTLSYLKLEYAASYKDAWEEFALALRNDNVVANNRTEFNELIYSTKKFSDYTSEDIYYYQNGLSDAKDFINKFKSSNLNSNGKYNTNLQNILDEHSKLVGYSSCGKGAGNAYGLSMFWAIEKDTKDNNPYTASIDTNFVNWAYLSNNYYGTESTVSDSGDDDDWGYWYW